MAKTQLKPDQINNSYSTTAEQLTGETWINGKPIYKRTVAATGPISVATSTFAHGITGIDQPVKLDGFWTNPNTVDFPYYFSATNWTSARFDATNLIINLGTERQGTGSFALTLYYTKV